MAIARHKTRQREQRDERALTRRIQRGDRKAFELLYASYEGRLYRVCYRLTGSSLSAAALVEATFTRALADLPEGDLAELDVAGHLYGTARTLSYERHSNGGPPELDGAGGEQVREVGIAGRRIAPRQRMVLALRDLEGRPDHEIAAALGCEGAQVAALVARARLRLRGELDLPAAFVACDARLPELSASSDGTLPAEARPALESHVAECAHCRAALFALREAQLRYRSLPTPIPPGEFGTRMAAALDAVGLASLHPAATEAAAGTGGRQTAAAIAMAALVVVGAAVTIAAWQSEPSGGESSHLPRPRTCPRRTRAPLRARERSPPWPSVPAGRRRGHSDNLTCAAAGGSSAGARPAAESSGGPQPVPLPDRAQPGQSTST